MIRDAPLSRNTALAPRPLFASPPIRISVLLLVMIIVILFLSPHVSRRAMTLCKGREYDAAVPLAAPRAAKARRDSDYHKLRFSAKARNRR